MRSLDERVSRAKSNSGSFVLRSVLGLALAAALIALPSMGTKGTARAQGASASAAVPATTYCITDDTTGDNFQFTFPTGTYTFTHGGKNPVTLTGTGVTRNVGVVLLNDAKPDRSVSAGFIPGQGTGRANVVIKQSNGVFLAFTVNQTIPNAPCAAM